MKKTFAPLALALLSSPALAEPVLPVEYTLPPGTLIGPPENIVPETALPVDKNVLAKQKRKQNWKRVLPAEIAWQVLHVVDIVQTIDCVHYTKGCYETNHIMGRHPSKATIIGWMGAMGVAHYFIAREASELHPAVGYMFEAVTIIPKAKTVRANAKLVW